MWTTPVWFPPMQSTLVTHAYGWGPCLPFHHAYQSPFVDLHAKHLGHIETGMLYTSNIQCVVLACMIYRDHEPTTARTPLIVTVLCRVVELRIRLHFHWSHSCLSSNCFPVQHYNFALASTAALCRDEVTILIFLISVSVCKNLLITWPQRRNSKFLVFYFALNTENTVVLTASYRLR